MTENGAVEDKRFAELKTINPATEEVINRYKINTKEQINDKVKKARDAFDEWKKDSKKRTDLVHDFAQQLRKDKEELAKIATKEMGKAIKEARSEVVFIFLFGPKSYKIATKIFRMILYHHCNILEELLFENHN